MEDKSSLFDDLRQRYPEFVYEAYHYEERPEGLRVWFDFRMGDVVFHPESLIERRQFLDFGIEKGVLERLVFDIGMVELVSYWKCACPPLVKVACGTLTDSEIAFWRKLYWHGLGEFFYTNGITSSPDLFMDILPNGISPWYAVGSTDKAGAYLVPIGGGKDSVVTLELLRRAGKLIRPLIMNPRGATEECARIAGFPLDEVLVIRRKIDPTLLELNSRGYLNGHTPFSAMLAFYTRLASALSGIPNVALSNENSANESTVLGTTVNHQYSKSLEFEDDFRRYVNPEGKPNTFNYFSFLRPLSELQIAMLFSRFTAYHDVFRSCNVGSKQDIWCGHCAKCLFAYIILSPFIEPARLNQIFGKSMLDDLTLKHEFEQLIGEAETKPFECVGTVSEVRQALSMSIARWYPSERPALIDDFNALNGPNALSSLLPIGNLTAEERQILQAACTEKNN